MLVCALANEDLNLDDFTAQEDVKGHEEVKEEQGKKGEEKEGEERKEEGREEKEPSLQEGLEEAAQPSGQEGLPQQIETEEARVVVYEDNVGFIGRNSSDVGKPRPFGQHLIANIGVYVRQCFNDAAASNLQLGIDHAQMVSEAK